ncbi:S-layer homology domain-containing protein [Pelotomaculum terephthalicicum JT]|uniref:S-layer homology domain-containing protein n=1 Tax=Pelotomaculum TaxID=191373 RepID=UPI0009CB8DBA|nr:MULTISPECIES: S-layer homology domain-containing protein [Pelotomaculum]MCG9967261.1 S-layer homology domain-containing protein [Pelotomaculum terephthalicicum JT]OPX88634.1 MAG: Endo-1,4-beta-xylanase A precursor [Pelotomaculum sp. PtaB.Bin117]OPY63590.1 MAG: Endo-1,4-beta-xylanase A precursor [Pelotomaculum sp. PtaU1.Bin065]
MINIRGFRLNKLLAAVVGLCIIAGLLAAAPPPGAGAAEPVALTVTGDGVEKTVQFTLADLQALPQKTYTYSGYNHWPSLQIFKDMKGPTLKTLLDAAGLKENATMIRCKLSADVYSEFTKAQLLDEPRYYFPDGEDEDNLGKWPPTRSERGKVRVETMLALNESNGKIIYGQCALNEPTCCKNQMLGGLCEGGTIEVTTEPLAQWEAPAADIPSGAVASGKKVTLQHRDGTPYHAIVYYTLDGSEPTYGSNIFNISYPTFQPELNRPIPISGNMVIKTKTIGMGKLDSEVVTYQYNTGSTPQAGAVEEKTADKAEDVNKPESAAEAGDKAAAAAKPEHARYFTDLEGHWAKDDIYSLADKGIIDGVTATEFQPEEKITRAQFAKLLVTALNIEAEQDAALAFADVPAGAWYRDYVAAAVRAGLIMGYTDSAFAPEENITREQMAVILARALQMKAPEAASGDAGQVMDKFADKGEISPWAGREIALAVSRGLVSGLSADTFGPQITATRAEAAAMILRLYKQVQ